MELFIESNLQFEKVASETVLSEDPNTWSDEILQEVFKQVPYIADFEPHVIMDRVDAERGFGFGHVEIINKTEIQHGASPEGLEAAGIKQARIPIMIRDRKLQPFDILVTEDGQVVPLTEPRLRSAIFRPSAFDITGRSPGDMSMIGQLYPPQRQNFGGGGLSMGKMGSFSKAKEYNHYSDHMNAHIKASGGSLSREDFDAHTTAYNEKHGKKFPCMGKHASLSDRVRGLASNVRQTVKDRVGAVADKAVHDIGQGAGKVSREASREAAREGAIGTREGLGDAAKHIWETDKHKIVGGGVATAGLLAANKGVDYAVDRHKNKNLAKDIAGEMRKGASLLEAILPTIEEGDYNNFFDLTRDPVMQAALIKNGHATAPALQKLASWQAPQDREIDVVPTVVQVSKGEDGYTVKSASHRCWLPKSESWDRGQVVKTFGVKVAFDADTNGSVTMMTGAESMPTADTAETEKDKYEIIKDFGIYKVRTQDGKELVGFVFPNLIDVDGTPLPLFLFSNGSEKAIQSEIVGVAVGSGGSLFEGEPRGTGCFYETLTNGKSQATVPMTIVASLSNSAEGNEGITLHARTFDGREVQVQVQPNITKITGVDDSTMLVPEHMCWLPLDTAKDVQLLGDTEAANQATKVASGAPFLTVTIRAGGMDNFYLEGLPLSKVAQADRGYLSFDDALFLLAGLGVNLPHASAKLAAAAVQQAPMELLVGRHLVTARDMYTDALKTASDQLAGMTDLRVTLLKEAAVIPDPVAVDTVLSLGFINPENISTFLSYLPKIDESQKRLCELLIAARLGLREIPISALEKAIRSTEEVINGLKVMAFQTS